MSHFPTTWTTIGSEREAQLRVGGRDAGPGHPKSIVLKPTVEMTLVVFLGRFRFHSVAILNRGSCLLASGEECPGGPTDHARSG